MKLMKDEANYKIMSILMLVTVAVAVVVDSSAKSDIYFSKVDAHTRAHTPTSQFESARTRHHKNIHTPHILSVQNTFTRIDEQSKIE